MATRGDWRLGANGCQGASWSDERKLERIGFAVSQTPSTHLSSTTIIMVLSCFRVVGMYCYSK